MFFRKAQRLRQQPHVRFGGTHDGHGPRAIFDDDFRARAHVRQERGEVVRGFRFRDVDHILSHLCIIHRAAGEVNSARPIRDGRL